MTSEDWKKAIKLSKEELIEWLDEMYQADDISQQIIRNYEQCYPPEIEYRETQYGNYKEKIFVLPNKFKYCRRQK